LKDLKNLIVHQVGYISYEDMMAQCYSAADVFVYPTHADTLPNALIESIACGTPAITNDIGGCGEIIQDGYNGFLCPPDATQFFAERILHMIRDAAHRRLYSVQARLYAEKIFSLQAMTEAYMTLFKETIHNQRRA
jgi:glycosyltransferase involved in cell wall biosynthesis